MAKYVPNPAYDPDAEGQYPPFTSGPINDGARHHADGIGKLLATDTIDLSELIPQTEEPGTTDRCAYDFKIGSTDGSTQDILSQYKGKVTLLFNCAAGCGNIPQHSVLQELHERYASELDFNIQAIVVDDFTCHGYPEFAEGLDAYAKNKGLDLTPGQVAEKYARDNFGVEYEFSELTKGRFDKHTYDPEWVPGAQYEQEPHDFWLYMTGADNVERDENNLPHHYEASPWGAEKQEIDYSKPGFSPLQGNFDKFLVDRTGHRVLRYTSSFLLGERDQLGKLAPWWTENGDEKFGPWPSELQRRGIKASLDAICKDIDAFLAE